MRVAVVGGGIVGANAARFLAQRGHAVTVFDPRPPGHTLGSSHGRSRIVRRAYPDAFWTAIMTEAYPMWAELEAESGTPMLHEVGLLTFGARDSEMLASMEEALTDLRVPFRAAAPDDAPMGPFLKSYERGVFVPEGGWVAADLAWRASFDLAVRHGAEHVPTKATPESLQDFDRFVVCPGGWISEWVPALDVMVTKQTFAYLEVAHPVEGPVWIHDSPELFYGFPTEPGGSTVKIGVHRPGPRIDADSSDRAPDRKDLEALRRELHDRFYAAEAVEGFGCLYSTTPDEGFRLGTIGSNGLFLSACSGHAFKMGPWLGRLMADLADGRQRPEDHPAWHVGDASDVRVD